MLRVRALLLGDVDACHCLGAILATGDHGESLSIRDQVRAARWYSRAARRGHPESQYDLGFMFLLGEGVTQDSEEALRWIGAAADAGYSEAMRLLADLYSSGRFGVASDEALAAHWANRLSAHLEQHPEDLREYERET